MQQGLSLHLPSCPRHLPCIPQPPGSPLSPPPHFHRGILLHLTKRQNEASRRLGGNKRGPFSSASRPSETRRGLPFWRASPATRSPAAAGLSSTPSSELPERVMKAPGGPPSRRPSGAPELEPPSPPPARSAPASLRAPSDGRRFPRIVPPGDLAEEDDGNETRSKGAAAGVPPPPLRTAGGGRRRCHKAPRLPAPAVILSTRALAGRPVLACFLQGAAPRLPLLPPTPPPSGPFSVPYLPRSRGSDRE